MNLNYETNLHGSITLVRWKRECKAIGRLCHRPKVLVVVTSQVRRESATEWCASVTCRLNHRAALLPRVKEQTRKKRPHDHFHACDTGQQFNLQVQVNIVSFVYKRWTFKEGHPKALISNTDWYNIYYEVCHRTRPPRGTHRSPKHRVRTR